MIHCKGIWKDGSGVAIKRTAQAQLCSSALFVSPQMTLTADELFVHNICVTYDIETILGRFGHGPNLPSIISIS